jgi:hypothetical protein
MSSISLSSPIHCLKKIDTGRILNTVTRIIQAPEAELALISLYPKG